MASSDVMNTFRYLFDSIPPITPIFFHNEGEVLYIRLDIPGCGREDVRVELTKPNKIEIMALRKNDPETGEGAASFSGHIEFLIPEVFYPDRFTVTVNDGVFKLMIPKIKCDFYAPVSECR